MPAVLAAAARVARGKGQQAHAPANISALLGWVCSRAASKMGFWEVLARSGGITRTLPQRQVEWKEEWQRGQAQHMSSSKLLGKSLLVKLWLPAACAGWELSRAP